MRPLLPRVLLLALALASTLAGADTRRTGATTTALDRYVATPDPAFQWTKAAEFPEQGATSYTLDLVSQHWRATPEVNRPEWRHWLVIVKPDQVDHDTALLMISGGGNGPGQLPRARRELVDIAKASRSVVAELRMVPNQTLVFDGDGRERKEDDLIAYTWDKFLRTGDDTWPARLPMTKASVRAMDAVTAFLASPAGGSTKVERFMVTGASKRGWTTWTTAAVDRRVVGICPLVIDILNVETSMDHHFRAYGFFAPAVGDYVRHHVTDWMGTPESKALYTIEDPYSYRDRFTMPKLLINACGDQFFVLDSSRFYFHELPGPKYLRYVPNTDHSLRNSDVPITLLAWHEALLARRPLPQLAWSRQPDGSLRATTSLAPREVRLWHATNPKARDFRLETFGPGWEAQPLAPTDGAYVGRIPSPNQGWSAFLIEFTYDLGGPAPLKLTTEVIVTPETLPFASHQPKAPRGFLTGTRPAAGGSATGSQN